MAQLRLDLGSGTRGHGCCHPLDIAFCVLEVICERSRPITSHRERNDSRRIVGNREITTAIRCGMPSLQLFPHFYWLKKRGGRPEPPFNVRTTARTESPGTPPVSPSP